MARDCLIAYCAYLEKLTGRSHKRPFGETAISYVFALIGTLSIKLVLCRDLTIFAR